MDQDHPPLRVQQLEVVDPDDLRAVHVDDLVVEHRLAEPAVRRGERAGGGGADHDRSSGEARHVPPRHLAPAARTPHLEPGHHRVGAAGLDRDVLDPPEDLPAPLRPGLRLQEVGEVVEVTGGAGREAAVPPRGGRGVEG